MASREEQPMNLYEPLDVDNYEFRVLSISPSANSSPIRCTLRKTSLINEGTAASYRALSYCWGDPHIRSDILVNNVQTAVTKNLYDALWQLRELKIYEIWVDAICINQEDKTERSLQVRFMKRIYERAREVIAWLGTESRRTKDALDFLSQSSEAGYRSIETVGAYERNKHALRYFFDLPYWTRVWIIQEIAVGSSVSILCGPYKTDWTILDSVDKIAPTLDTMGLRHVNQVRGFRQTYQDYKRISLIEAMRKSQAAQSTDPRDKIYALLGLTSDGDDLVPYPNYRQPIGEVLRDFTKAIMKSKRSLDYIFFRPIGHQELGELPTWAVDWVGLRRGNTSFLDAKILPIGNFTMIELPDPNMLRVRGRFVGKVSDTFDCLAVWTTSLRVDHWIQGYYDQDKKRPNAISDAICASLFLQKVEELDQLLKGSRQDFFSLLWSDNGQLDPGIHAQISQALLKEPPHLKQPGLELNGTKRKFETKFDHSGKPHEEDNFIAWLVRIGSCQISGKRIQQWLVPKQASTSIATDFFARVLQGMVSGKPDYSPLIRSLVSFYHNQLKLVVTHRGMIGAACAMVQSHDEVYLLTGARENTPILLRRVKTTTGPDVHQVVGGVYMAGRGTILYEHLALVPEEELTII